MRKTCPECDGKPNWLVWNESGTRLVSVKQNPHGEPVPCPYCEGTGKFSAWLKDALKRIRNRYA